LLKTSTLKKLFLFFFIALFAIIVTAGTSFSTEEEKTMELKKGDTVPPSAETQKEAQTEEQKTAPGSINPAARVNGVAISRAELDTSFNGYIQQRGMNTGMITDPEQYKQVQLEVLEMLISRELLWQEAKKKNYVAKDEDVKEAIGSVKSKFPSEDDFKLRLSQSGYTEKEYTEFLRQQLSVRELVQKDIAKELAVSDDEVHGYYESNPEQFKAPEQVRARHILVKVDPSADEAAKEAAKKKIEGILTEAKGGADFAEMAKKHSEGPSRPNGGDLGFFSRGQMVKPFDDAAFALKPGEISDVVNTVYGYHIIKVEEKREPRTIAEEDVREQVRQFLQAGKVQGAVKERVNTLRSVGDVEILIGN
jgi:peptidyl-prolyl cis-trans isomerase C